MTPQEAYDLAFHAALQEMIERGYPARAAAFRAAQYAFEASRVVAVDVAICGAEYVRPKSPDDLPDGERCCDAPGHPGAHVGERGGSWGDDVAVSATVAAKRRELRARGLQ